VVATTSLVAAAVVTKLVITQPSKINKK